jgi:porphyrinogen peroxidase
MSLPQFGIFAQGTAAHRFLEFRLAPAVGVDAVAAAFSGLRQPAVTAGGVNIVLAFGPALWRLLAPAHAPASLHDFHEVVGRDGRRAPAAQHDAWLWLSGATEDVVFEHARAAALVLEAVATVVSEQSCFAHRDSRDLTGFIDGTANPQLLEAPSAALIPPGQVGEGGSHVLAMRWVHNLEGFGALPVSEQEAVIGRTKPDSSELDDLHKPATAHISRVEIRGRGGEELPIYRRSVPYGSTSVNGLYFVAFSADVKRFDRMLARMFGSDRDGLHDRLTDFSRPAGGAYYFAPALSLLAELAATIVNAGGPPRRLPELGPEPG